MLYVKRKKIFIKKFKINFKSNAWFVFPRYTRGPVNRSLQPAKDHAQIYDKYDSQKYPPQINNWKQNKKIKKKN